MFFPRCRVCARQKRFVPRCPTARPRFAAISSRLLLLLLLGHYPPRPACCVPSCRARWSPLSASPRYNTQPEPRYPSQPYRASSFGISIYVPTQGVRSPSQARRSSRQRCTRPRGWSIREGGARQVRGCPAGGSSLNMWHASQICLVSICALVPLTRLFASQPPLF